jgi:hypothetical protein
MIIGFAANTTVPLARSVTVAFSTTFVSPTMFVPTW